MTVPPSPYTAFSAGFLGLVIFIANTGQGGNYWSFLSDIPLAGRLAAWICRRG